jgi:IPT/TIG domain
VPYDRPLLLLPGDTWTVRAAGPVGRGDPVQVAGDGTVERAGTGSLAYVGIAAHSCGDGGLLTVIAGWPVITSPAGSDIAPGDLLMAGDDGTVLAEGSTARVRVRPGPAAASAAAPPAVADTPLAGVVRPGPAVATAAAPLPDMDVTGDETVSPVPPWRAAVAAVVTVEVQRLSVISVTPDSGVPGTQAVTVRGTGFIHDAVVDFGPAGGPRYRCVEAFTFGDSPTQIRCTVPSGPADGTSCTCWVTTAEGTASLADAFLCTGSGPPPPTVTSVTPNSGTTGTPVRIDGAGFSADVNQTLIMFGGFPGSETTLGSSTTKFCNAPPGPLPGPCDVSVYSPAGIGTRADAFTYAGGPGVTAADPNAGLAGTEVSITGTGFSDPAAVRFGGFPATGVTVMTSVQIICAVPAGPPPGPADVTVTTGDGTGVMRGGFTYTAADPPGPVTGRQVRRAGEVALIGVALTAAAEGEPVTWLARRPRYPAEPAPAPPAPGWQPPPAPHGPVTAAHAHLHDHGYGPHSHLHAHRTDNRHAEGPGHPHDLRTDG